MKERLKGLLVLWLAFLMVVSTPMTANAKVNGVYLYKGSKALADGDAYPDANSDVPNNNFTSLIGASNFDVNSQLDTILENNEIAINSPTGYSLNGWKFWNGSSGGKVCNPELKAGKNYKITQDDYDKYVNPPENQYLYYMIIEPMWKLDYEITHQPTNDEPYVGLNEAGEAAVGTSYEWYPVQFADGELYTMTVDGVEETYGEYNKNNGIGKGDSDGVLVLTLNNLKVGDTLRFTYSKTATPEFYYMNDNEPMLFDSSRLSSECVGENTVSLYKTTETEFDASGKFGLAVWKLYDQGTKIPIEVTFEVIHEAVTSVTGPVFSGATGDYYCKVIFENGGWLRSNKFTYTRQIITPNEPQNGRYKLQVDGVDITEKDPESETALLVKPETTVTVVPTPDPGYELDTISVNSQNSDGVDKEIPVEKNAFTMPKDPVTVTVSFKKKTYEITLPTDTVGYTVNPVPVEDVQKTSVEHGDDYKFFVSINNGYVATNDYAVKANDATLTATSTVENGYIYTIENVTEAQTITVTGVNELHRITTLGKSTEGSYTVTAGDGSDVPVAAKGTVLTITPTPAEGYELDKITVIQKDGSDTAVTVDAKNQFTMPDYPVEVSVTFKKTTYGITLPQNQIGYTVKSSQTSPVEHGSDYTFKVTVGEGYDVPIALVVKTNGTALEATSVTGKEYTYTIKNVAAAQEITVGGVSDTTAPALTITLDETNFWEKFLPKIVFNLFFKEDKSLTITSTDAGSGIRSVMYYVSETDLFPNEGDYTSQDIENKISKWTEYTNAVSISGDSSYVVYAKATDVAGNVTYVSTSRIVIDATAPVISGLENGGQYYGDTSATISDANLSTVKLDGKAVEFTEIPVSITITADGADHTIEATDKAGNQNSYKVTVSETWVRDGISTVGSRVLKLGVPYKFGSGKWKVAGDTTVYEGGNTFYASEGGTFDFQSQ